MEAMNIFKVVRYFIFQFEDCFMSLFDFFIYKLKRLIERRWQDFFLKKNYIFDEDPFENRKIFTWKKSDFAKLPSNTLLLSNSNTSNLI